MESTNQLYQPSITEGWEETKSYDIKKLFFVVFFGGVIPLLVLGTRNAIWFKVSKIVMYGLIGLGVLIISAKFVLLYLSTNGIIQIENSTIKFEYRVGGVLLYFLYYFVMRTNFQQHLRIAEDTLPILKPAIKWAIVGMVVEVALLILVFVV